MVALAEKARGAGLLALEQDAEDVTDPFLRDALQNIADGTDADELRILLEDEISTAAKSRRTAAKFYNTMGGYAPTIGIIGTVVALTHVLENLGPPETLGPAIATAFVATLWGLLTANFMWLPIGARLNRLCDLEIERMTLMMEGALAVQSGSQPRLLGERLRAMVPAHRCRRPHECPPPTPQTRRAPRRRKRRAVDGVLHGHGHSAAVHVHRAVRHLLGQRGQIRPVAQLAGRRVRCDQGQRQRSGRQHRASDAGHRLRQGRGGDSGR